MTPTTPPHDLPAVITIPVGKGLYALVDSTDARLAEFKWHIRAHRNNVYARRDQVGADGKRHRVMLHREVLGVSDPAIQIDHINGNGLDCRRSNLRIATHSQNLANRGPTRTNRSGFKGVSFNKHDRHWRAQIQVNTEHHHIGCFRTAEDAARAYDDAARRHFGDFARLNFPHDKRTA